MSSFQKIGILGNGSWATALAKISSESNIPINWYVDSAKKLDYFKSFNANPSYLKQLSFKERDIEYYDDLEKFLTDSDVLLLATPSPYIHATLKGANLSKHIIFIGTKGIIPEQNMLVSDYLYQYFEVSYEQLGVIAGPCHAEEIAMNKLSYLTLASTNKSISQWLQDRLACFYLRIIVNDDLLGIEMCAVLKNIFALGAGIAHGLGYGDNYLAVFMSNATREMKLFLDYLYPKNRDIKESGYLGDLLVTGYSIFSRNRMFGNMIGKGYSVEATKIEMNMIAEGYYAVACIHKMMQQKNIPSNFHIIETVYKILYEKVNMHFLFEELSRKFY